MQENGKPTVVKLNARNLSRLKQYHNVYGATLTFLVNRAVEEWCDSVGDVRMEALAYHAKTDMRPQLMAPLTTCSEKCGLISSVVSVESITDIIDPNAVN